MKITLLTLFPRMIKQFFEESITKKAQEKNTVDIDIVDIRNFAYDKRGSVDDKAYGGGTGMVIRVDVIYNAISSVCTGSEKGKKVILTSPQGVIFNQGKAEEYSRLKHLVIVCGHYEGFDERVKSFIDEEVSIGDFIMTGGEIAAVAIADSVIRLVPNVLKEEAVSKESFCEYNVDYLISTVGHNEVLEQLKNRGVSKVRLLEYPQYTKPYDFMGLKVPDVLLSGNHKEIERWRIIQSLQETLKRRPDLLGIDGDND